MLQHVPSSDGCRRPQPPTTSLDKAIQEFQAVLSSDQRHELQTSNQVPTVDDVMTFTANLDSRSRATASRSNASKVHTLLQSVREYTTIVDIWVSSHPNVAALVWGAVKLTMMIATNITSYFEPLSDLFMKLGHYYPRFSEYQALYSSSTRLQRALGDFHAALVQTCKHAVQVMQRSWKERLLNSWQGFETEFSPDSDCLKRCYLDVKGEILLAQAQADHEDKNKQDVERSEASAMRRRLSNFMGTMSQSTRNMQKMQMDRVTRKKRQRLLDRLSVYDHTISFNEACGKRLTGTAQWILEDPRYKSWTENPAPPVLWCSGKIGSGKTVLCSSVIQHVLTTKNNPKIGMAYFFIDFHDRQTREAEFIIRSIVRQALNTNYTPEVEYALQVITDGANPPLSQIVLPLELQIRQLDTFYIMIDGIDECEQEERNRLYYVLKSMSASLTNLKVYLAGREGLTPEISHYFHSSWIHISTNNSGLTLDIEKYVKETLRERIEGKILVLSNNSLCEDICRVLTKHADGMILWANYLIDELCIHRNDQDILQSLESLPRTLQETFERALSRIITRGTAQIARKILFLVAVAERHLTLEELREALAVEIGKRQLPLAKLTNGIENVATWCENLLQINGDRETVQFPHAAIFEFITQNHSGQDTFHINMDWADHQMGEICVTYLSLDCFLRSLATKPMTMQAPDPLLLAQTALKDSSALSTVGRLRFGRKRSPVHVDINEILARHYRSQVHDPAHHPFLEYAKVYWLSHTTNFSSESTSWDQWRDLVLGGNTPAETPWAASGRDRHRHALEWAALNYHSALTALLTSEGHQGFQIYKDVRLVEACLAGDEKSVDYWLSAGAICNVDFPNTGKAETPLMAASRNGHIRVINQLVSAGSDLISALLSETGPLSAACRGDQVAVVDFMLEKIKAAVSETGANFFFTWESFEPQMQMGLYEACCGGYADIALQLISEGATVSSATTVGGKDSLLHVAVERGHLPLIYLLLKNGADPKAISLSHGDQTALEMASSNSPDRSGALNLILQDMLEVGELEPAEVEETAKKIREDTEQRDQLISELARERLEIAWRYGDGVMEQEDPNPSMGMIDDTGDSDDMWVWDMAEMKRYGSPTISPVSSPRSSQYSGGVGSDFYDSVSVV